MFDSWNLFAQQLTPGSAKPNAVEQVDQGLRIALDPYLLWARLTGRNLFDEKGLLPVLAEFSRAGGDAELQGLLPGHLESPPTRIRSLLVDTKGLTTLLDQVARGGPSRQVIRFEIGLARSADVEQGADQDTNGAVTLPQAPRANADTLQGLAKQLAAQRGPVSAAPAIGLAKPLLCVIDDRANFASTGLRASGPTPRGQPRCRVESIWLQEHDRDGLASVDATKRWSRQPRLVLTGETDQVVSIEFRGAFYGRTVRLADGLPRPPASGGLRAPLSAQEEPPEPQAYRDLAYFWPPTRFSHGSAVLDLVAGAGAWGQRRAGTWGEPRWHERQPIDDLRFVQLPDDTVLDTAGGSLASHVLDGIHHAVAEARPGQNVIVNLSFGTYSGPHDGTSLFERALVELLDHHHDRRAGSRKRLHVVLPAGNAHLQRVHAGGTLHRGDPPYELLWKVLPDNAADAFVEIWLPIDSNIEVDVTPPAGDVLKVGPAAALATLERAGGGREPGFVGAVFRQKGPPQGPNKTLVLVACRATRPESPQFGDRSGSAPAGRPGPHGVWRIALSLPRSAARLEAERFDAWIQRSDAAPARGRHARGFRGRQSYFLEPEVSAVEPLGTLNGIATLVHPRAHVIGASRRSDDSLSPYSAGGPGAGTPHRFEGPDAVVPVDESLNQPGLLLRGAASGARLRVSGTSMAAAVYTRMLYERLASDPDATDVVGPAPLEDTRRPPRVAGAPLHADPMHRGERRRIAPRKPDGSL